MKRTPLKRKTPLARASRMPARRGAARRSSRVLDPSYLAWIRRQPCAAGACFGVAGGECIGASEPEHKREGVGMGQKSSDLYAYPICRRHHGDRHDGRGAFGAMSRDELRAWVSARIVEANSSYARVAVADAEAVSSIHQPYAARFTAFYDSSGAGCWEWSGARTEKGYGCFYVTTSRRVRAHRIAWEMANGRLIPRGLMVMHLCDNRACVRPDHLRVGTASENNKDCVAKGRRVRSAVDVDQSPGRIEQRPPASAGGHLSRALEQLLPEPGAIAVGTAVELGGREGSVLAVLPGGRIAVRWLDGEVTDEALPGATTGR